MARQMTARFRIFVIILGSIYFTGLYFFHKGQHQDDNAMSNESMERREALQIINQKFDQIKLENKEKKMLLGPYKFRRQLNTSLVKTQRVNIAAVGNNNIVQQNAKHDNVIETAKNNDLTNNKYIEDPETDNKAKNYANPTCHSQNKHLPIERFVPLSDQYDKTEVWVYSAYLDSRKSEAAFIRMMVLANIKTKPRHKIICEFEEDLTVEGIYYELCENHRKTYGGFIISCPVPASLNHTPCNINVYITKHYGHVGKKVKIPIYSTEILPQRDDFGICVPPLFGNIDKHRLIEFIEMSLIIGATKFVFYDYNLTPEIKNVLDYYTQRGVVDLVKWHLPVDGRAVYYKGQILAVNECLYREMASLRYVAFHDIDELIVPRQHEDVPSMMSELAVDDNVAFCLESAFYDPGHNPKFQSTQLISLQHRTRTIQYHKVRRKCIVEPRKIFEQGIHHISKQNEEYYQIIKLDPDIAILHHYRKCMRDFGMNCDKFVNDNWIDKYSQQLEHNFNIALTDINRSPFKVFI
ncbi:unnamed protein product [Owenia fusiformis]|uniref:Glycosyltransferase family 92 protein n=1 Tax=Owenia fusiformis TaxID=6347 RepID=A0A8J1TEN1_OWEFU|nr:unnamed protein product [Owenia fusiformis]CAH1798770.1 unnamed protein product [Owenia fusiformis]